MIIDFFKIIFHNMEKQKEGKNMQQVILEEIVKLQAKGLLTIPKNFREELGFEENGLARIKKDGRKLTIEPVSVIGYPIRTYSKSEIRQFIKDDRLSPELAKKVKQLFK